jgi:hypothetical protein
MVSVVFFMMIILGLDTMVSNFLLLLEIIHNFNRIKSFVKIRNVETTIGSIYGALPIQKRVRIEKFAAILVTCTIFFILDLPLTLNSGTYWIGISFCSKI